MYVYTYIYIYIYITCSVREVGGGAGRAYCEEHTEELHFHLAARRKLLRCLSSPGAKIRGKHISPFLSLSLSPPLSLSLPLSHSLVRSRHVRASSTQHACVHH